MAAGLSLHIIYIRKIANPLEYHTIYCRPGDSIELLKGKLMEMEPTLVTDPKLLKLFFNGIELDIDEAPKEYYGIGSGVYLLSFYSLPSTYTWYKYSTATGLREASVIDDNKYSVLFDSASYSYIDIPPDPSLFIISPFTLEFWFKTSLGGIVLGNGSGSDDWSGTGHHYYIQIDNSGVKFNFNASSSMKTVSASLSATDNRWHHVAVSQNEDNLFRIWVDGTSGSSLTAIPTIPTSNTVFYIGSNASFNNYFEGLLSNLRFTNLDVYNVSNSSIFVPTSTLSLSGYGTTSQNLSSEVVLLALQSPQLNWQFTPYGNIQLSTMWPFYQEGYVNRDTYKNITLPSGFNWNPVKMLRKYNFLDTGDGLIDFQGKYKYFSGKFLSSAWNNIKFWSKNQYFLSTHFNDDHFRQENGHSKIIGFCFDGLPIYGPYGYTDPLDSDSGISLMKSSYRIRQTEAPRRIYTYDQCEAGTFLEDYEYIRLLGDLEQFNGRYCVTPEFPQGTYAYFLTFTDNTLQEPAFPYVFGYSTKLRRNLFKPSLNEKFLTAEEWSGDQGVLEIMFIYELYKGLGLLSFDSTK
jgi:hypothetical protein